MRNVPIEFPDSLNEREFDSSFDSAALDLSTEPDLFSAPTELPSASSIPDTDLQVLWERCLRIIRDNVDEGVYAAWFSTIIPLRWADHQLTLQVPSQFFYEWLEEHYYTLIQKTLGQIFGAKARLQYQVVVDKSSVSSDKRTIHLPGFRQQPTARQNTLPFAPPSLPSPSPQNFPSGLNPRYTFESFIRGESNQLASAAALAIANQPGGTKYNPLVVYGDTGLGKTHLAQAIGNHVARQHRNHRVLYTNSERFTMEYVQAVQHNKLNEFTAFYRSVDVLIVDDIQFFSGKEKTQDNFFHTFNALHQAGKQIILTSDKPPKDLHGVDDRLISRFQWGLTADVQAPDFEMRLAILSRKAMDEGTDLPMNVLEYIARHMQSSVRQLEGCLVSLLAKVTLDGRELTLELAREVVSGVASATAPDELTPKMIIMAVSEYFRITVQDMTGKSRKHDIVVARQMAMYLMKEYLDMSLKSIGAEFGGRDHTTVIHSCQTLQNYLDTNPKMYQSLQDITNKLGIRL